jgi:hypothetical protein
MQSHSRTLAIGLLLFLLTSPSAVFAAYTSAVTGATATMTGDAAGDTLAITATGGLLRHNRFTAGDPGFTSDFDFDSTVAGEQTLASTSGIVNIDAGDGNDVITLGDGINLRGTVNGGVGTDRLDYAAYTTAVTANLGLNVTGLTATLGADQENPATTHTATATAAVTNYNIVTHTFDIVVTVTGLLPADVSGFHIHRAPIGVNGPIIVDFTGVAPLVPAGTGFTFTAAGLTLPAVNEAAFLGGGTYVNIHTAAFPGGAIRGQLFPLANAALTTGAATGTTSITNIEQLTGGAGGDSLVGNSGANILSGGPGADWIVGGPGGDTQNGEAGADLMVWSNGDGSDINEGGSELDTVVVNGSPAAGDVFLVAANGARLRFDRTNLGLFNLDIGTVETLTVSGIGGADSFTVNDLTGVASLTTVGLNGLDGNDAFVHVQAAAGPVTFNTRGGTGTDTLTGPNAASTWHITAANHGNITGLIASFTFIETLTGGTANDTFNVRAFATASLSVIGGTGADTLNYNAEFRAVSGDVTPPDGAVESPGVPPLPFTSVETVNILNPQQPAAVATDFTGDRRSDIAVYRPSSATWLIQNSETSALTTVTWGQTDTDVPVPADYDGDGRMDVAVYRPRTGEWFVLQSSDSALSTLQWGAAFTDVPVSADYDGDRKADIAVYRPSTGQWFVLQSSTSTQFVQSWGGAFIDVPVPGDYDGDGKSDLAVYRPSAGTWFIVRSSDSTGVAIGWGQVDVDVPVNADYDGDGATDIAVYRPTTGTWFILPSSQAPVSITWGQVGVDVPVPADYDGDGLTDIAVYRPTTSEWFILQTSNGALSSVTLGAAGDIPLARRR